MNLPYCQSLFRTIRRPTRVVMIGEVPVGGKNPIRVQSMTTTDTKDVAATLAQSIALAEAGCEIVRVTAPNITAARCLRDLRRELDRRKIRVPLVADIHFLPAAAMEAVEHVEKVRVNPGNYADRKKFAVREYSDSQYEEELQRLHEAFSPLVKRCKELGRSMRIGTNHGSLSDRIMNRFGDTSLGMVESAMEFLRIAESHGYREIVFSMKASNPKVMIQAYRLLAARLDREGMDYPLHLGVTEAGDGEDGRIKSAIGIGSLLADGLGDTIRVSLTEDPVAEIPVAMALASKAHSWWTPPDSHSTLTETASLLFPADPYSFSRRKITPLLLGGDCPVASDQPPRVVVEVDAKLALSPDFPPRLTQSLRVLKDNPVEGILLDVTKAEELRHAAGLAKTLSGTLKAIICSLPPEGIPFGDLSAPVGPLAASLLVLREFGMENAGEVKSFLRDCRRAGAVAVVAGDPLTVLPAMADDLAEASRMGQSLIFTLNRPAAGCHGIGSHRLLAAFLHSRNLRAPVWIRHTPAFAENLQSSPSLPDLLLDASVLTGGLLCDGIGDLVSLGGVTDWIGAARLTYNLLQGAGARISKTEFVACPSCGRTLFDLQTTTRRIRARTGHLKGVKIAIMGCIVNGPGEMADADFGYVGGAPGRINLYVGKECVEYHIPAEEADQRLVDLIKKHGKWVDPGQNEKECPPPGGPHFPFASDPWSQVPQGRQ